MTKEMYAETAKFILNYKSNTVNEIADSLALAQNMIPASRLKKMQPDEVDQVLINLGWEIYQFNNSEI